jgi:hypothetical protein
MDNKKLIIFGGFIEVKQSISHLFIIFKYAYNTKFSYITIGYFINLNLI